MSSGHKGSHFASSNSENLAGPSSNGGSYDQYGNGINQGYDGYQSSMGSDTNAYMNLGSSQTIPMDASYYGGDAYGQGYAGQGDAQGYAAAPQQDAGADVVNPLVAARAREASEKNQATGGLYPLAPETEEEEKPGKPFDPSFGDQPHPARTAAIIIVVLILLAALLVGGFFFMQNRTKTVVNEDIARAIDALSSTDTQYVSPIISGLSEEYANTAISANFSSAMNSATLAQDELGRVGEIVEVGGLTSFFLSADQRSGISAVKSAVDARKAIISIALQQRRSDKGYPEALEQLNIAYSNIGVAIDRRLEADGIFTGFNTAFNEGGDLAPWNMTRARDAVNEGIAANQAAQDAVAAAKGFVPEGDYAALEEYLAADRATLEAQLRREQTVLDVGVVESYPISDEFAALRTVSEEAHGRIPADANAVLSGSYAAVCAETNANFNTALANKNDADARVQEYVAASGLAIA